MSRIFYDEKWQFCSVKCANNSYPLGTLSSVKSQNYIMYSINYIPKYNYAFPWWSYVCGVRAIDCSLGSIKYML